MRRFCVISRVVGLWDSTEHWVILSVEKAPFSQRPLIAPPSSTLIFTAMPLVISCYFFAVLLVLSLFQEKCNLTELQWHYIRLTYTNSCKWCSSVECTSLQSLNHLFPLIPPSPLSPVACADCASVSTVLLVCISVITVPLLIQCWGQSVEQREWLGVRPFINLILLLACFHCCSVVPDLWALIRSVPADACLQGSDTGGQVLD